MSTGPEITAFTWSLGDPGLHPCTVTVSLWEFWTSKFLSAPHLTYKARTTVLS